MVYVDNDVCQTRLVVNRIDTGIPEDHECRLIKRWIDDEFSYVDEAEFKKRGRPAYRKTSLLSIVIFAYKDGITSCAKISEYCRYNILYRYMGDGIEPDERTFQYFLSNNHSLIQEVLKATVKIVDKEGLSTFEHASQDGTTIKAYNSPYNILKLKDIEMLLEILENNYTEDEIKEKGYELRKSAYKLLKDTNKTVSEKIELLYELKSNLEESEQSSIALNDPSCRWMHNKKKQAQLSWNMQQTVDTDSKIIVAVDINDQPTDHYQLVEQIDNIEKELRQSTGTYKC